MATGNRVPLPLTPTVSSAYPTAPHKTTTATASVLLLFIASAPLWETLPCHPSREGEIVGIPAIFCKREARGSMDAVHAMDREAPLEPLPGAGRAHVHGANRQ